jgi:putative flippase GtrA
VNLELIRYLFVGIGSNVMNFIIYLIFCAVGFSLLIASLTGYAAGLTMSYHFGRIWVFGKKFEISKQNLISFAAVYVTGGVGMSALIEYLDKATGMDYRISWLFGAGFAVVNNFVGLKYFVFKKKEAINDN